MALSRSMKDLMMGTTQGRNARAVRGPQKPSSGTFNRVLDQGSTAQRPQGMAGKLDQVRDKSPASSRYGQGIGDKIKQRGATRGAPQTGGSFGGIKPRPSFDSPVAARAKPNIQGRQVAGVQGPTRPQGAQRAFGGSRRFLR